ncbi:MAG TPA: nucleotidyltransferase family protein [Bryobacteraceae bacterium]|nr:nucleotidyltransferase family protein [Bryobacteraceae bacterium]
MQDGPLQAVPQIPPERIVLACARAAFGPAAEAALRTLLMAATPNWDQVTQLAHQHAVFPAVAAALSGVAPDLVPAATLARVRRQLRRSTAWSLAIADDLLHVDRLLRAERVPYLPFKGPALASLLCGTPCLRQCADLDLLIEKRDSERAVAALERAGYVPALPPGMDVKTYAKTHSVLAMERPGGKAVIELHWELMPASYRLPLEYTELDRFATPVLICGTPLKTFGAEHTALVLAVHGAKHCWERLGWIRDIALLVHCQPGLDWARVVAAARKHHCCRMLVLSVEVACSLFPVKMPEAITELAKADRRVTVTADLVRDSLFRGAARDDVHELAFAVSVRDRVRDCAGIWLRFVAARLKPNEADERALKLPAFARSLYWLIRPLRLFTVYGARAAACLALAAIGVSSHATAGSTTEALPSGAVRRAALARIPGRA